MKKQPRLPSLDGRVVLVTGGNSGIGEATAAGLASLGAQVAIVSRDAARGEAAVARLKESTGREVGLVLGDLGSRAGVDALAEEVLRRFPKLHVLVNNAGLIVDSRQTNADGLELTFAVNHLGPFLLTHRLLDRLLSSGTARVVNVSSAMYARGALDFDDLQCERSRYVSIIAYARSKMCNVLFTRELALRTAERGLTTNCLHPGVIRSRLGDDMTGITGALFRLAKPLLRTPEAGARTSVYLAASHEVAQTSGEYFVDCAAKSVTRFARDTENARRLWTISSELCGLPLTQ